MKNEFVVTKKMFKSWKMEAIMKPPKIYMLLFWTIIAALSIVLLFLKASVPFNLLIFAYCIYQAVIRDVWIINRDYRKMADSYGEEEWKRRISFNTNDIVIHEDRLQMIYKYSELMKVKVKNKKIVITAKDKEPIHLYTDTFVGGDWEKCKKLLKEKNGELKVMA